MAYVFFVLLGALVLGIGTPPNAPAQEAAPPVEHDPVKPDTPARRAYLPAPLPNTGAIIGPPPASSSAASAADIATFWSTRALQGSPRWALATNDVAQSAAAVLDNFACALGYRLNPAAVPKLITLFDRVRLDVANATRMPKDHYRRIRPHIGNDAPLCVVRDPHVEDTFSYPSSHATLGWTLALILASLVPERATAILTRGRVYGESRVICGLHWRTDVEAGRTIAAALYAALAGHAAFRADLEAVRTELQQALAASETKPDAGTCEVEAAATATAFP